MFIAVDLSKVDVFNANFLIEIFNWWEIETDQLIEEI